MYLTAMGQAALLRVSKVLARKRKLDNAEVAAIRCDVEPVPKSRIKEIEYGDVFDLRDDEKLRIIFAPGHQPSGIMITEEKNNHNWEMDA